MSISSGVGIVVAVILLALVVYFRMSEESLSAIKSLSSTMPKMGEKIDGLKKIAGAKWFKKFAWASAVVLFYIFFLKPEFVSLVDRNLRDDVIRQTQAQARAEEVEKHKDIKQTLVATKDRPVRIIPRSEFTRTTWIPLGQVAYTVTYPTDRGAVTVVFPKVGPLKELPYPLAWMEFRPVNEDSVIMVIKQHDP